jgi:hypothetical protein
MSKRFATRQQLQWDQTRRAFAPTDTCPRALDGTLRPLCGQSYLGIANDNGRSADQAVAA